MAQLEICRNGEIFFFFFFIYLDTFTGEPLKAVSAYSKDTEYILRILNIR